MQNQSTMKRSFIVEKLRDKMRLDQFLVAEFRGHSRAQTQKWIRDGFVIVNGTQRSKHFLLSHGDTVRVEIAVVETKTRESDAVVDTQGLRAQRTPATSLDIPILFEDDVVLIINKPAGLVVHPPHAQYTQPSVVDFLLAHVPAITNVGGDPLRPGIVHRLDKEVSGVMIVAKTNEAYRVLQQQFAQRSVTKEYRAIVYGVPPQETGDIRFKLAHSKRTSGKMAARPEHEEGREAWTTFTVLQLFRRYALLAVQINTGRTHQIRAHLAAIDHPIVGDSVYYSSHYQPAREAQRLYLHAYQLGFVHPVSGEHVRYTVELPPEFTHFANA